MLVSMALGSDIPLDSLQLDELLRALQDSNYNIDELSYSVPGN